MQPGEFGVQLSLSAGQGLRQLVPASTIAGYATTNKKRISSFLALLP